jgi:acetolactate synthase small subunit
MPRPKVHERNYNPLKPILRHYRVYVTCPRCGSPGLLSVHMGYLAVRHNYTVHLVPASEEKKYMGALKALIEAWFRELENIRQQLKDVEPDTSVIAASMMSPYERRVLGLPINKSEAEEWAEESREAEEEVAEAE